MCKSTPVNSCGGSHGSGPVKVIPTMFPFHPAGFARLEPMQIYVWQSPQHMARHFNAHASVVLQMRA